MKTACLLLNVLLLTLTARAARGQSSAGFALLDSTFTITLARLNKPGAVYHNDTVNRHAWNEPLGDERVQARLKARIFRRYGGQHEPVGRDSSIIYRERLAEDFAVTNVRYSPGAGVRVVVLVSSIDVFLLTLRPDLSLIDFVKFNELEPPGFSVPKRGRCTAHSQGHDATLTASGRLTQNDWTEVHDCKTYKLYYKSSDKTTYQLQPNGTFRRLPKAKPAARPTPAAPATTSGKSRSKTR